MKTLKILFVLCIMLGFAATALSQGKGNQVVRPMKGTFYATVTATVGNHGVLSITGNATHIGNCTGSFEFYPAPPDADGYLIGEKILNGTLIAANGDKIFFWSDDPGMKLDMPVDLNNITGIMLGLTTISGGTGRFLNCSGEILNTGTFNMTEDHAMWRSEGSIKY